MRRKNICYWGETVMRVGITVFYGNLSSPRVASVLSLVQHQTVMFSKYLNSVEMQSDHSDMVFSGVLAGVIKATGFHPEAT